MSETRIYIDRRAHERIDDMKADLEKLHFEHANLRRELSQNTILTQQVASNTSELVDMVKGAKGLRKLVFFFTPIIAGIYAFIKYMGTRL